VKKDLFCERVPKYGGCEVRDKLLKITNMIFEQEEVPSDFTKL